MVVSTGKFIRTLGDTKRILFVDDEPAVLDGQRKAFEPYHGQVECLFALGAAAALKTLQQTHVDVVVADMHMPEIDGPELLRIVKAEYPEIVRCMACPRHEMHSTYFALMTVQQILAKPLDPAAVMDMVERACRLRELMTDSLRKKIGGVGQLPPIPAVYSELSAAMAGPEVSSGKIAAILEKDPAMAAKVLQLVNSACFGTLKHIGKLEHAVAYLGMDLIRDLSLTAQLFVDLQTIARQSGFSFEGEQQHSLLVARVAKRLLTRPAQAREAFTAGLLHDIGKLVLAVCIPKDYSEAHRAWKTTGRALHEVEYEVLGFTHSEAGAYLLGLWGLPAAIVEAVAFHHNPGAALEQSFGVSSAVSLANSLVDETAINSSAGIMEHLQALGVADNLPVWTDVAQEEVQQVRPERVFVQ
ncbi:MAG TPA: response regulator [Terriglobia bacterium]|jgi:HD-like signal output (HDOD) protein